MSQHHALLRRWISKWWSVAIACALLTPGLVLGADVLVDANGTGGNGKDSGSVDDFRVVLNGPNVEIYIDGNLSQSAAYGTIGALTIEGSSDDDTLTVDLSGGNPIPFGGITFNGRAQSTKDTLRLTGAASSITYNYTGLQDGTIDVDGHMITYTGLEPIQDNAASGVIVINGTTAGNSINYTAGVGGGIFTGNTGLFAVDNLETIEFNNKTNVIINSLAGGDTINLNNPKTPAGLTGIILVIGADPTGSDGDNLIVNGVPAALDNIRYLPTSVGAGTVMNDNQPQPNVLFTGIERLTIVVQQADGDGVRVDGTAGNDEIEFFHGLTSDSGSFVGNMDQNNATGSGPFMMTPMNFTGAAQLGNDEDVNFFSPAGTDSFVFNATTDNDVISVIGGEGGGTECRNTLNGVVVSRLEIFNVANVLVRTLDGNNTVNVTVPAGPAVVAIRVEGGSGSNTLNFNSTTAATANLGAGTVQATGANVVTYTGIDVLNVNPANHNFSLSATAGDDELEITPTGANALTAQLTSSVPAVAAPVVNGSNITTFSVDLLSGSNRLTVNGTQAADTVTVTGALVTVAGRTTVNYSNAQSLTVNGLAGNDSFTVTPSATTAIFADGGDPIGALPGNQLKVVSVATDTVTFSAGPTSDSGIVLVNANQPVSFVHFNLLVPPQISSGPTATPNPALVGQTVNFSVAATGGFAALTFSWDFGDGTLGTGATTTHTYSAAGSFTVTLSVSDGVNPAVTGTVSVTVNAPATIVGTGPDTDGDGFSDSFETAVGTDPNSAASTPTGAPATAGAVKKLSVVKASIKLNFSKPGSDSIAISGGLLIPDGFNISGQTVFLDVGGVAKKFVLDGKGSSPKGNDLFAVAVKSGKGGTPLQVAKYSIKLSKGNFATALGDDGLTNTTISKSVTIPVTVIFNGDILQKSLTQTYKATTGKSGATK